MLTPQDHFKPGKLTILGSGISSIGQLTLQAVAHIEQADIVFYVLSDPATEAFIQQKNPNCVDLYTFYDNGKARTETYIQMSEVGYHIWLIAYCLRVHIGQNDANTLFKP